MAANGFEDRDALGLAELVRRGEVGAEEVLDATFDRIARVNPALNAVVEVLRDAAMAEVRAGLPDGPFRGVPIVVKALLADVRGSATTAGCRFFAGNVAAADSEIVARFRRAGLLVVGRSNTSEFGLAPTTEPRDYGPTRNPWDPSLSPGGSSGGSAAAVAAGLVPLGHATDGGGSIRIPASCCGLFGMKPTRGRVSMAPLGETWAGAGTQHAVTRSVRDSAALLDAIAGPVPGDPYAPPPGGPFLPEASRDPRPLRIAFAVAHPSGAAVDPACRDAVLDAARLCAALGHHVEEAFPEHDWEGLRAAFTTVMTVNTRANLLARAGGRRLDSGDFERATWALAERGAAVPGPEYVGAVQRLHRATRQLAPFFERYDALLTPVLTRATLPLGHLDTMAPDVDSFLDRMFGLIPFTYPFNVTGQPAMSVPLARTAAGAPLGVQFAGRFGDEALLFRLAGQLERARPWPTAAAAPR